MNDHFVTNFNKKNNRFDNFFVHSSKLPLNKVSITKSFISSVDIKESEILNILKSLDARKAMDMVISQLGCYNCPINQFRNH